MVVLPSPGCVLVTSKNWVDDRLVESKMDVRKTAKRFCQRRVLFRLLINAMPCQSRLAAVAIFFATENLGVFQATWTRWGDCR